MSTPLERWVQQQAELTKPDRIHWCDGSEEEARWLMKVGMEEEKINGKPVFCLLNQENGPLLIFTEAIRQMLQGQSI